jgi:hypothetical protein
MNRIRWRTKHTWRQWLGLCLVLLLAFAPPFNLAGVDLALQAQGESASHYAHGHDGHSGPDHSRLAHHAAGTDCLQCLVLGGMSLAGAATAPDPALQLHTISTGWTCAPLTWDSRGAKILVCRGPPTLA